MTTCNIVLDVHDGPYGEAVAWQTCARAAGHGGACSSKRYVLLWLEADDEEDAERLEEAALTALASVVPIDDIQNRIQGDQP